MKVLLILTVAYGLCEISAGQGPTPYPEQEPTPYPEQEPTPYPQHCMVCEIGCPYGLKMGQNGCPECECAPVPDRNHPCKGYQYCGSDRVCVENNGALECKAMECPRVEHGYRGCGQTCTSHSGCSWIAHSTLCCPNGCGHVCINEDLMYGSGSYRNVASLMYVIVFFITFLFTRWSY